MSYNLKFKEKGERGYWSVSIYAENEKEAIEKSIDYIKNKQNIEKIILEKTYYKTRKIFEKNLLEEE